MSFETSRSSRAALVVESVEGTPVSPTSGTDYVALQEGFIITPNFNTLESAELSGTIGKSAPTQGLEAPTASFSHYLRHSGTEATQPNYYLILKSLFGTTGINSSERSTTTSSTTSVIKLGSGGGDFSRGKAILLKDLTNGYSVRNVTSVDTNDLTLAFNVGSAPATGQACGKCIYYTLTESNIPSFTLWNYVANGGAVQMLAGVKTESATMTFTAGEAINADYSFMGTKYYFNPIEITASNHHIDFTIDGGSEINVVLTNKIYVDPAELATEIQTQMDAATSATITCTYSSSTGKFTIAATSGASSFSILWNSGTNNANGAHTTLGFTKADDTSALSYTSDNALSWASPQTPTIDSESMLVAKANEFMMGTSAADYACMSTESVTVNFGKTALDVLDICASSGKSSTEFVGRDITVDVVAYLVKHDISKWLAFKNNDTVKFAYNCGRKSNSNWVAGSVVNLFSPTAKISSIEVDTSGDLVKLNMTLTCFSSSALPEFYMNLL